VTSADAPTRSAPDGFRSDINGLRAISIALVVAYHLAGSLVPGGFIGVDVFFVISGFLMTEIIAGRLRQGRFGLWDFYVARLRRIWPALVTMCLALWVVGATLIDPWTFERIAADVPSVLFFASNVVFARRQGYFAPDENANWLLHTWSLSVEWQFYLLFPLLLLGLFAVPAGRRRVWVVLGALAAASFVLAVVLSARGQGWSFYILPTRAWELLAGALCASAPRLAVSALRRGVVHAAGLLMIAVGAWLALPAASWPSAMALLPVGGAALVIAAGVRRTFWAENPAVAILGRASYSIYLWHWPVIVALRYAAVALTPLVATAAIAAILALGLASYWLVERSLTRWLFAPRPWRWGLGLGAAGALAAGAVLAAETRGLEALRTAGAAPAEHAAMADLRAASADWAYPGVCGQFVREGPLKLCRMGVPAARQVLVIGDSHADQIAPRYAHAFGGPAGQGITFATAGCMPAPGVGLRGRGPGCATWADAVFQFAQGAGFRRVVIVSAWTVYFEPAPGAPDGISCLAKAGRCDPDPPTMAALADAEFARLADAIRRLRRAGIEVVLMQPTPQGQDADPLWLYRRLLHTHDLSPPPLRRADFERDAGFVRDHLANVAAATGAILVDPLDALCPGGACPVEVDVRALYKDSEHFRPWAVTQPSFAYLDAWLAPGLASAAAPMRLK
jgi:peptidoglycan/LPS O-acetylase OafA/YrhL